MLQVKHLVKRYVSKGETVVALNDVSVDFPEKGMVFLLGKSGSGKSTLLNISGGLDSPDEGEVVVKGRSSKDFSKSDFDSYRNTYVGFIFQEYNILNELTVKENVALAVELQGLAADEERVADLLRQVDLDGYADRRPNTLSGGQKQRVAIARALVKNPEIIMADEPTGALDSNTGKQVFDTLKKLSEEKLVVIVSHDREFAEVYADRIIELKDGNIISDVTRGEERAVEHKNLSEVSENKLAIGSGTAVSEEEERAILAFLRRHKGGVVISSEEGDLALLPPEKSVAASFTPTDTTPQPTEEDSANFIKSRFPFRYAVKMGLASLRVKPLRLAFTALLATVAFIVFGVFSTLVTFSAASAAASTLNESAYGAAVIEKHAMLHLKPKDGEEYMRRLRTVEPSYFSEAEIAALKEEYPQMNFLEGFTLDIPGLAFSSSQPRGNTETQSDYYSCFEDFTAFSYASALPQDGTVAIVAGTAPAAANEILVSIPVYETFAHYGYFTSGNDVTPIESYEDLLGKTLTIRGNGGSLLLTISGIFDAGENFSQYDLLKSGNTSAAPEAWSALKKDLENAFTYSMSAFCFVGDGFREQFAAYGNTIERSFRFPADELPRSGYLTERGRFGDTVFFTVSSEAEPEDSYVEYLFASLKNDRAAKCGLLMELDARPEGELDINYEAPYAFMADIREATELLGEVMVFLGPAAAVLAVFAALLLFNFISASINAKKKEIGILRAVGARGIDVFKIFIVESAVITLACFVLGCLGALAVCLIVNAVVAPSFGIVGLFSFGIINVLFVLAISFVTAIISTVVPVSLTARKKPVEAIRAL